MSQANSYGSELRINLWSVESDWRRWVMPANMFHGTAKKPSATLSFALVASTSRRYADDMQAGNSYEGQQVSASAAQMHTRAAPLPWTVTEVLSEAFVVFKQDWLVLVLVTFVASALTNGIGLLAQGVVSLVSPANADTELLGKLVAFPVQLFVSALLLTGQTTVMLRAARREPVRFGQLFSGFGRLVPMLVAHSLALFLIVLGYVLLIVPGVVLTVSLLFFPQFVTEGRGPLQALSDSWNITKGHRWQILVFVFAISGLVVAGLLACLVGVVVAVPVIAVALAIIYTRLTGTVSKPELHAGPQILTPQQVHNMSNR